MPTRIPLRAETATRTWRIFERRSLGYRLWEDVHWILQGVQADGLCIAEPLQAYGRKVAALRTVSRAGLTSLTIRHICPPIGWESREVVNHRGSSSMP
jgi:hypothetical protein